MGGAPPKHKTLCAGTLEKGCPHVEVVSSLPWAKSRTGGGREMMQEGGGGKGGRKKRARRDEKGMYERGEWRREPGREEEER